MPEKFMTATVLATSEIPRSTDLRSIKDQERGIPAMLFENCKLLLRSFGVQKERKHQSRMMIAEIQAPDTMSCSSVVKARDVRERDSNSDATV